MMPTVGRLKTRPQFLKVAAARRKWVTPGLVLQAARRQPGDDRAAPAAVRGAQARAARRQETGPEEKGPEEKGPEERAQEEPEVRVGFTVTRKVGNAVERNRVKRRLRAVASEVFERHGRAGTDYVVIGRAATLTRPFDALREDLEQAIVRLDRQSKQRSPARGKGPAHKEASPKEASS